MDNTKPNRTPLKNQSKEYLYIRKIEKLNNLVGMLQEQNYSLLKENSKLSSTVSDLKAFNDELKEQMFDLTEERQNTHFGCKNQQQNLLAIIEQLKKVIADLDQDKAVLECSMSKLFYSDSDDNSSIEDFEVKFRDMKLLYEESLKIWEQEKIDYQHIINNLQQDLILLTSSKLQLEQNYKQSQDSVLQLNQTISECRHSNSSLDTSNYSIDQTYRTDDPESSILDISFLKQSQYESHNQINKKDQKEYPNRQRIRSMLHTSSRNAYKLTNNLTEIVKKS